MVVVVVAAGTATVFAPGVSVVAGGGMLTSAKFPDPSTATAWSTSPGLTVICAVHVPDPGAV
jgi:hypothetical protein